MIVKNISKNTLYAEDCDQHIPYYENEKDFFLSPDTLKKSKCIQGFIIHNMLSIVEHDEKEHIEKYINHLTNLNKEKQNKDINTIKDDNIFDAFSNSNKIEVKIHGLFYDASGYAKVNRNIAKHLSDLGIAVKVSPKNSQNQLTASELSPIVSLEKTQLSKNHILIDSIIPSFSESSSAKYKILYTTIESYSVPDQFIKCCDLYNEIWVTSPFAKHVLQKHIKKPIYVIPAGIDDTLYTESGPKFQLKPNINNFIFLSVFAWGYRKGYDVLLKSYFEEFSSKEDVSLLIVSRYQSGNSTFHKNKIMNDINKIMKQYENKELPHVARNNNIIPEKDMPNLYRSCNCFVLPTRGEGSNLTAPEASLCGLPVIMTNCSGQTMYLRDNNSFLIEPDIISKTPKGLFEVHYWDEQEFPQLTSKSVINQCRKQMRYVFENHNEAKEKNKNLQNLILSEFTWKISSQKAKERLMQINSVI